MSQGKGARNFCIFIMIAGGLSLLVLTPVGHLAVLLVALSGVGLPFALLMFALPGLAIAAMVGCVLNLILRPFIRWTGLRLILVAGMTALVLTVPLMMANKRLEAMAEELMADDRTPSHLPAPETLVFFLETHRTECTPRCLRLLLNGQVKKVVIMEGGYWEWRQKRQAKGHVFWLEKGEPCDLSVFRLLSEYHTHLEGDEEGVTPRKLLNLRMLTEGICLKAREVRPEDIKAVLYSRSISNRNSPDWPFSEWNYSIDAYRLSYFRIQEDGDEEIYRATHVRLKDYMPLLAPTVIFGSELRSHVDIPRRTVELRGGITGIDDFLTKVMGLRLHLDTQGRFRHEQRKLIEDILNSTRPFDERVLRLFEDYFRDAFGGLKKSIDRDDRLLALRVLTDERLREPDRFRHDLYKLDDDPVIAEKLIERWLDRLEQLSDPASRARNARTVVSLIRAIRSVNASVRERFKDRIVKAYRPFVEDPCLRAAVRPRDFLVGQFPEAWRPVYERLGRQAVQARVDECRSYDMKRVDSYFDRQLRHVFEGFCILGERAREAIPLVLTMGERLDSIREGYLLRERVKALVSMGMDEQSLRDLPGSDRYDALIERLLRLKGREKALDESHCRY